MFNKYLLMATFYANREYIAENLCVNRDHPEMHCNGQCQLDKKLKDTDDHNQPNSDKKIGWEASVFIFQQVPLLPLDPWIDTTTPRNGVYKPLSLQSCYSRAIHPPAGCMAAA